MFLANRFAVEMAQIMCVIAKGNTSKSFQLMLPISCLEKKTVNSKSPPITALIGYMLWDRGLYSAFIQTLMQFANILQC